MANKILVVDDGTLSEVQVCFAGINSPISAIKAMGGLIKLGKKHGKYISSVKPVKNDKYQWKAIVLFSPFYSKNK